MTELVAALRAIFAAWNTGERLDFRGEYYRHTLMTPTFSPGANPYGPPPIYVGALGPRLTRATAEDRRRPAGHAVRLEAVPARGDDARGSRGTGRGGPRRRRISPSSRRSSCLSASRRPRSRRDPSAAGVLRVDARVPARARRARLGRSAARAQRAVQTGPLGGHGPAHRRRRAAHHRRLRQPRPRSRRTSATASHGVSDRICLYQPGPIAVESLAEIVDALDG